MSWLAKSMKELRRRRKEINSDNLLTSQIRINNSWYANAGSMRSEPHNLSPCICFNDLMALGPKEIVISIDHNNVETERAENRARALVDKILASHPDVEVSLHSGKVDIEHFRDVDVVIDVQNHTFVILKAKRAAIQPRAFLMMYY